MTAPAVPLTQSTRKGRRELKNAVATGLIVASFVIALIPLTLIVLYVIRAGTAVFSSSFLTDDLPFSNRREGGGMYPAIVGTLVITGTATAMAVPLGILGGIYLNEYGKKGIIAQVLRFLADVGAPAPSALRIAPNWRSTASSNPVCSWSKSVFSAALSAASVSSPWP